jgi:hypothetical protein
MPLVVTRQALSGPTEKFGDVTVIVGGGVVVVVEPEAHRGMFELNPFFAGVLVK